MVALRVTITVRSVLFVLVMIVIALFAGIATCLMMTMVQFGLGCIYVPIATGFHKLDDAGRGKCELPVQKHDNQHATKKLDEETMHYSRD